ncbi:hypothetical protein PV325_011784, partial [Microctonus aethiopoides]
LLQLESNIAVLFPEEFHQEILKTYFTDMSLPSYVSDAAQYYLINAYINPSMKKLESRLSFYSELFIDILKNQWDIPDPREPNVYPANYMVDTSMIDILWYIRDNNIRNQFIDVTLKSFRSVLSPLQAPLFYSYYIFASLYRGDEMSRDECVKQIGNIIPSLIDTFSVEFVTELIKVLIKCLKLLWKDDDLREEVTIDIIEGLLKLNIKDAITLPAVNVMLEVIKKNNERCIKILRTLRTRKNPAAIAYACMQINKSNVANNNSPMYLEAIRNATDSTPKLSSGLPEIAIPFVKLEIEKILHPEEITERQKLDGSLIFHRAIQTNCFM